MRLLHVIRSADPTGGGPIEVVRQFGTIHLEQGHCVETLTLDAPSCHFLSALPGNVHAIGTRSNGYGYTPVLTSWLREHGSKYDVALVHGLWQFHGRGTRAGLKNVGVPYFVYPHGMLDPWFRRAYPLKHLKKALYWRLFEHRVVRDARAVLFTCEEERQLARRTFQPYRCVERIAPLGINSPSGNPDEQRHAFFGQYPELRGKRIYLFFGRIHEKKGCDLLIRAFGDLNRTNVRCGEPHLVLAGPCATPDYLKYLQTLAATHCHPNSVSFTGMLLGDLKWGALHAADVFVLPSHQENFGLAVVESLSCGVPVLISNKVNIWREIDEDDGGLVAEDTLRGTQSLLEQWENMDPHQRTGMRAAARNCFVSRFYIDAAANRLTAIISEGVDTAMNARAK